MAVHRRKATASRCPGPEGHEICGGVHTGSEGSAKLEGELRSFCILTGESFAVAVATHRLA